MKHLNLKASLAAALLIFGGVPAQSETLIAASGKEQVQLVELYSSESCSSCPPADVWISSLKDRSGLWKKFVPVVFHVDYWNNLGWKDGFSSNEMTRRQIAVSKLWAEPSVYTPAIVVDGKEWKSWRNSEAFPRSIAHEIELSIYKADGGNIRVKASGLQASKKYVVRIARLGMDLGTNIKSGENAGKFLKHNFLVMNWEEKPISKQMSEKTFSWTQKADAPRTAIAAWIEEQGSPAPLQSTGGYL